MAAYHLHIGLLPKRVDSHILRYLANLHLLGKYHHFYNSQVGMDHILLLKLFRLNIKIKDIFVKDHES